VPEPRLHLSLRNQLKLKA